jgi:dipeptidyl aminopeptidase/acylaminoacyl peptidase
MRTALIVSLLLFPALAMAEIRKNPGSTTPLPHDKYIRVVSETDSPVQQVYVKSKDGAYVATAIRKPKGNGPFPAIVIFHGAPGGRGMEQLVGWSRGVHGGPVWERFLQEGYVVAVGDYRGGDWNAMNVPSAGPSATAVDDGIAVVNHVSALPYVDKAKVHVYGVSLGGNLVMFLAAKVPTVRAVIAGAPAPIWFLGMKRPEGAAAGRDSLDGMVPDAAVASANIDPIKAPILIVVGTEDRLQPMAQTLHDLLAKQGKSVRLEIYEGGYHDFVLGPQGQNRPDLKNGEALYDSCLDALEKSVSFVRDAR